MQTLREMCPNPGDSYADPDKKFVANHTYADGFNIQVGSGPTVSVDGDTPFEDPATLENDFLPSASASERADRAENPMLHPQTPDHPNGNDFIPVPPETA